MHQTAQLLRHTIQESRPKLLAISAEQANEKPFANKWSLQEIIGHLIDSAANNHQRFVRMQQVADLGKFGYDQTHWVNSQYYQSANWEELVQLWYYYNLHLSHVIANLNPDTLTHTCDMGYDTPKDLRFVTGDYVKHLQHHLNQIFDDTDPLHRRVWGKLQE